MSIMYIFGFFFVETIFQFIDPDLLQWKGSLVQFAPKKSDHQKRASIFSKALSRWDQKAITAIPGRVDTYISLKPQ